MSEHAPALAPIERHGKQSWVEFQCTYAGYILTVYRWWFQPPWGMDGEWLYDCEAEATKEVEAGKPTSFGDFASSSMLDAIAAVKGRIRGEPLR